MQKGDAITAAVIFPGDGKPPVENATLIINEGRIEEITTRTIPNAKRLENCALIPGLVNAHTHLEFSDLQQPFTKGEHFPAWIRKVIAQRRENLPSREQAPEQLIEQLIERAIQQGLVESYQGGSAAVGEICTHLSRQPNQQTTLENVNCYRLQNGAIAVRCFYELIGFQESQIEEKLHEASHFLETFQNDFSIGLSPHAPYSVHPILFEQLVALAQKQSRKIPLAIHLAETKEELQFLDSQTGPFREMLDQFQIFDSSALSQGGRPFDYLQSLSKLARGLVIHGNYLNDQEIEFLGQHPNLFVVYCPRTHAHFEHDVHPWKKMLERGVSMALGTDSRASNPDLNLWGEMQFLTKTFPEIDPQTVFDLGTIQGAKALQFDEELGSLAKGKKARVAVVSLKKGLKTRSGGESGSHSLYRQLFALGNTIEPLSVGC